MFNKAQSFFLDSSSAQGASVVFVTSIELYFKDKPTADKTQSGTSKPGVSLNICEVKDNVPNMNTADIKTLARVEYDNINTSASAATSTIFTFDTPVPLQTNKQYAFLIKFDNSEPFALWKNRVDEVDIVTGVATKLSSGKVDGNAYDITHGFDVTPLSDVDYKFKINVAKFTGARSNPFTISNEAYDFLKLTSGAVNGTFIGGEYVYQQQANLTGTVVVSSGGANITGTSTTFASDVANNDLVVVANSSVSQVRKINIVTNTTFMNVTSNFSTSASAVNIRKFNTGTISTNASSNTIIGTNTSFASIASDSYIVISDGTDGNTEVRKVVRALNKVININRYSTEKGRKGGLDQRAIAIGTQGLADVFYLMDYIFTSDEARKLNKEIFETIYFAAITESNRLCMDGKYEPYAHFNGSPMSQGIFQFDMWGLKEDELSKRWPWGILKENVSKYGVCNSLFTAQMPVASSAKITGSYEMTEPAHSAIFNRRVVGGEIMIVNKYLISDFEKIGIWSEDLKNEIIMNEGSIQNINFNNYLDQEDKNYNKKVKRIEHLIPKYKTIWEISQRELIDMAADRAPFIDQSQSMNIYMSNPTLSKISSSHFYGWEKGLKTLCYYVRTRAISTGAKHLAMDVSKINKPNPTPEPPKVDYSSMNLPSKPDNSQFDCFGCSS